MPFNQSRKEGILYTRKMIKCSEGIRLVGNPPYESRGKRARRIAFKMREKIKGFRWCHCFWLYNVARWSIVTVSLKDYHPATFGSKYNRGLYGKGKSRRW